MIVKPDESMMIHLCNVVLVLLGCLIILGLFCFVCFARIMANIFNVFSLNIFKSEMWEKL